MKKERSLIFYAGFAVILPITLILGCLAICVRNLYYHLGWIDTPINAFENSSYSLDPIFTTAAFGLLIIMGLIEEVYKKALYIKVGSSNEIIIFRFFRKHVLYPSDIDSIKVDKLFRGLGSLPNEIIRISSNKKEFIISKLYIKRYNDFKKYLNSQFDVIDLTVY